MTKKKQYQLQNLLTLIEEFKPHLCIFNTYILDKTVIEKISEIIPGECKIITFFDPQSGLKASAVPDEKENDATFFTENYLPVPVAANNGRFHSKLMVLIKKQVQSIKSIVVVGSFNLSKKSFSENGIESAISIELDTKNKSDKQLLKKISEYLININDNKQVFDLSYKDQIKNLCNDIYPDSNENDSTDKNIPFVYHGLDGTTIANELQNKILELGNGCTAYIASPYVDYSENLNTYIKNFNFTSVSIFTRRTKRNIESAMKYNNINLFVPANKGRQRQPETFHSKNYLFYTDTHYVAFVGSSNFTDPGFYDGNKNIECGFIIKGKKNDKIFNALFSWFKIGWMPYDTSMQPIEDTDPEDDDNSSDDIIFFLAELIENKRKKIVRVYYKIDADTKVTIEGQKEQLTSGKSFVDCEYKNKKTIKVTVNGKTKLIPIIHSQKFLQEYNNLISLGIFETADSSLKVTSTDYEKLKKYIESKGISIRNVNIKEPPILEQYYQNLKYEFSHLNKRKYFTKRELDLFSQQIQEAKGGPGIFKLIKLYELFVKTDISKLQNEIKNKIKSENLISDDEFKKIIDLRSRRRNGNLKKTSPKNQKYTK